MSAQPSVNSHCLVSIPTHLPVAASLSPPRKNLHCPYYKSHTEPGNPHNQNLQSSCCTQPKQIGIAAFMGFCHIFAVPHLFAITLFRGFLTQSLRVSFPPSYPWNVSSFPDEHHYHSPPKPKATACPGTGTRQPHQTHPKVWAGKC